MLPGFPVLPAASDRAIRLGVLAANALLLAGCSIGVNCKPCAPPVQATIIGVGPDPARVLQVCVDGEGSCAQLHIGLATESMNPGNEQKYPCTVSDPHVGCFAEGDTAYVSFDSLSAKDVNGRRVEVTATGGQAADANAAAAFQYQPKQGTCGCDHSHAQLRLAPR
jgi:hypothetical protein